MVLKKRFQTLAIVGNGFDLNHGYKSDYKNFVENTDSPALDKFRAYCEGENITSWYLFEENIRVLTEKFFLSSMTEEADFEDNRRKVQELADIFREIHVLLRNYLTRETTGRPVVKKPGVERYLNDGTIAINFNYSKTVEAYTKNVVYVHGSLEEEDIILGYDYRDEPCLAQYEDMRWGKSICRESLAFRRYLKKRRYRVNGKKYRALADGLESYHHWENSGRGLEEEVKKFIPKYRRIDAFLKKYRKHLGAPKIRYKEIKTIVVLGHGIEADRVFLREIVEKCDHVKKIVIYRYEGETDESYNKKASFFYPYCREIEQACY